MKAEKPEPAYARIPAEGQAEYAPLEKVDNEVIFVNQDIEAPFNIKEGERFDLGAFFNPTTESEDIFHLEKIKTHGRAGIAGRVIIGDRQDRRYRDIHVKGIGYVSLEHKYAFSGTPGIVNRAAAEKEKDVSEEMLRLGMRTSRVMAIARLKEIINSEGKRVSIEQAKREYLLRDTDEPVVEARLFGTAYRIQDLSDLQRRFSMFEDARMLVAQEFGKDPETFRWKEYMEWFAGNLGTQLAIMHRNGWVHNGLTEQNITLDGRIVDFATAHQDDAKGMKADAIRRSRDIERITRAIRIFADRISATIFDAPGYSDKDFLESQKMLPALLGRFKTAYLVALPAGTSEDQGFLEQFEEEVHAGLEF